MRLIPKRSLTKTGPDRREQREHAPPDAMGFSLPRSSRCGPRERHRGFHRRRSRLRGCRGPAPRSRRLEALRSCVSRNDRRTSGRAGQRGVRPARSKIDVLWFQNRYLDIDSVVATVGYNGMAEELAQPPIWPSPVIGGAFWLSRPGRAQGKSSRLPGRLVLLPRPRQAPLFVFQRDHP